MRRSEELSSPKMTVRRLLVVGWIVGLYCVTALAALFDIAPQQPALLELRNIIAHAVAYAATALLFRWSMARSLTERELWLTLALMLALGMGQELLQTRLRRQAFPLNSLLDLVVDVVGARLGLWLAERRSVV